MAVPCHHINPAGKPRAGDRGMQYGPEARLHAKQIHTLLELVSASVARERDGAERT